MSNALKAGFSIQQAIELVVREGESPIAQEFGMFLHQTRVGMRMEEAMESMQTRVGSDDLALMIGALETARQTGGNLTEVFEKIAHTIRERMRIEMRIRTLTAQGRLQGLIVGAMPLLLGVALFFMDPGMMLAFLRSGFGISILLGVLVLETIGALVIRKIIRIDV
jgi:tight adherence protein B